MDIDATDYAILHCLTTADQPLWKKQIHTRMLDRGNQLPGNDEVSVQTVGRRIDALHEHGYIQSHIINPEDLSRDLIIAYSVTTDGKQAIDNARRELLQQYAADSDDGDVSTTAAITLLTDTFNVSSEMETFLIEDCADEQVRFVVRAYHMARFIDASLDVEQMQELDDVDTGELIVPPSS